jgi:excisionase family DNA binding protein
MTKPLTTREAAAALGISPSTLYRAVEAGEVPHHKVLGKVIRFTQSDIDEILRASYRGVRQAEVRVEVGGRVKPLAFYFGEG